MKSTRPLASSAALYTYSLGRSLYVPLTSRCNSLTLPQTRGPEFRLPSHVVASLLRVRDVEHGTSTWQHWCLYLDTLDVPQTLPPPLERVAYLPESNNDKDRMPSVECLKNEIDAIMLKEDPLDKLVIGGEGEPTLLWDALLQLAHLYSHYNIRLTTNGLVPSCQVVDLKESGITAVSVALMTADSSQYKDMMQPLLVDPNVEPHNVVCDFIQQALQCQLDVEVTGVDRPDVDKNATEQLAAKLGVTRSVRWRPFFP